MAEILKTRIQSKRITYAQAIDTTSNFTPLEGEIILVRIDSASADGTQATKPTYIMKVGDGSTKIASLNWFHAPASDVYAWAKKSSLDINDVPAIAFDKLSTDLQNKINNKLDTETYNSDISGIRQDIADVNTKFNDYATTDDLDKESNARSNADTALDNRIKAIEDLDITNTYAIKTDLSSTTSKANQNATDIDNLEKVLKGYTTEGAVQTAIADAKKAGTDANTAAGNVADDLDAFKTTVSSTYETKTVVSGINSRVTDLEGTVGGHGTRLTTAEGEIDALQAKVANVTNVMDFVGAGSTLPTTSSSQKGDVYVITSGDDAGKEYVFDGANWQEFGYADANSSAITDLDGRLDTAESEIDTLQTNVANITNGTTVVPKATHAVNADNATHAGAATKVDNKLSIQLNGGTATEFDGSANKSINVTPAAIGAATAGAVDDLTTRVTDVEGDITDLTNDKADKATTLEGYGITDAYTKTAADNKFAAKSTTLAGYGITNAYTKTEVDNAISTAKSEIKGTTDSLDTRLDTVEANYLKKDGTTLKIGANTVIFDCGGIE